MATLAQSPRDPKCDCWVLRLHPQVAFGLRYGAHSVWCPKFRESRDPVDRQYDHQIRQLGERGKITPQTGSAA